MELHLLATAFAYVGAGLGVAMVVPQMASTFRDRAVGGVSALSWGMTALACFGWLIYGVRTEEMPQIPGNALIVLGASIIALAVPAEVSVLQRSAAACAAASTVVLLSTAVPPAAVAYLAFAVGVGAAWPQLVRSATSTDPDSAVSLGAWFLRAASQACWLSYALIEHDLPVTIAASITLASALALLMVERARRPQRAVLVLAGAGQSLGDEQGLG